MVATLALDDDLIREAQKMSGYGTKIFKKETFALRE
jgi:hypothetical protein